MLIDVYRRVNIKYNLLRLVLHNCLAHRASIKKYHESYKTFLRYIERVHPDLNRLFATKRVPIFPVKSKRHRPTKSQRKTLPPNTILIVGERTYYQFAAIKHILNHLVDYERSLSTYILNFDNSIIRMVNGMNDFRDSFRFFLQIVTKDIYIENNNQLTDIIHRTYSKAFVMNYAQFPE